MATLSYSHRALDDLARLTGFLAEQGPAAAAQTVDLIAEVVCLLMRHPLIGRPVESGLRELVISRNT